MALYVIQLYIQKIDKYIGNLCYNLSSYYKVGANRVEI